MAWARLIGLLASITDKVLDIYRAHQLKAAGKAEKENEVLRENAERKEMADNAADNADGSFLYHPKDRK